MNQPVCLPSTSLSLSKKTSISPSQSSFSLLHLTSNLNTNYIVSSCIALLAWMIASKSCFKNKCMKWLSSSFTNLWLCDFGGEERGEKLYLMHSQGLCDIQVFGIDFSIPDYLMHLSHLRQTEMIWFNHGPYSKAYVGSYFQSYKTRCLFLYI